MFNDDGGYVIAVVPNTHRTVVGALQKLLGRTLSLLTEQELDVHFADCEMVWYRRWAVPMGFRWLSINAFTTKTGCVLRLVTTAPR